MEKSPTWPILKPKASAPVAVPRPQSVAADQVETARDRRQRLKYYSKVLPPSDIYQHGSLGFVPPHMLGWDVEPPKYFDSSL
jgi:hypothetical protein